MLNRRWLQPTRWFSISVARGAEEQKRHAELIRQCTESGCLDEARRVHSLVGEVPPTRFLANLLVGMYGKCGGIWEAWNVFLSIWERNLHSWTLMIAAFAQNGYFSEALVLFRTMDLEGVRPNNVTFVTIIGSCTSSGDLESGRQLGARLLDLGLDKDTILGTSLLTMYGTLGCLDDAEQLFVRLGSTRTVVSWTVMIAAYARMGHMQKAIELYRKMDLEPNEGTFICLLGGCSTENDLPLGKEIHSRVVDCGLEGNLSLRNSLLNMYVKCGTLADARSYFDNMLNRGLVTWNTMITAYAQSGYMQECLTIFWALLLDGTKPDRVTFLGVLGACQDVPYGRLVQSMIMSAGLSLDVVVRNALISMFARCKSLPEARLVFDEMAVKTLVSWNSLLVALARGGQKQSSEALQLFCKLELEGLRPNWMTLLAMLEACGNLADIRLGCAVHQRVLSILPSVDDETGIALSNAVINMYAKCGQLEAAKAVFGNMKSRDVVSWNTLMAAHSASSSTLDSRCSNDEGFEQVGRSAAEVVALFKRMDLEGFTPGRGSFVIALDACASSSGRATKFLGRLLHQSLIDAGYDEQQDEVIASALVNMYGSCGDHVQARRVLRMSSKCNLDVITWTSLISSLARNGYESEGIELLWEMQMLGLQPDGIVFASLVAACARRGLLAQGLLLFVSMVSDHGIAASQEHYGSIVDLLGRVGWLQEAESLICDAFNEDQGGAAAAAAAAWLTLLGACDVHGDAERGNRAAYWALELGSGRSLCYLTLSNLLCSSNPRLGLFKVCSTG